jgi:hypothetical protein
MSMSALFWISHLQFACFKLILMLTSRVEMAMGTRDPIPDGYLLH